MARTTKRIAICGAFDMKNYGDLLFPIVAAHRLESRGFTLESFAPSATAPGLGVDAPRPLAELIAGTEPVHGVIIGGGYIIHNYTVSRFLDYAGDACGESGLNASWIGATLAACMADVPVVWNAPGVPFPFAKRQYPAISAVLSAASYFSVRDRGSARLLPALPDREPEVVPDPVVELSRIWPARSLADSFVAFRARHKIDNGAHLIAINVRARSLSGLGAEALGRLIDEFATTSRLMPVLVALGEAHDDAATARAVSNAMTTRHAIYDDALDLKEITSVLAHSVLYIGASLHGFIAASSYGVPGALVARPAYTKFAGYLEHTGQRDDLHLDWRAGFEHAHRLLAGSAHRPLPESVFEAMDKHWARVEDELSDAPRHSQRRQHALRAFLRAGVALAGSEWLLAPFFKPDRTKPR